MKNEQEIRDKLQTLKDISIYMVTGAEMLVWVLDD